MTEVRNFALKDNIGPCGCGCGLEGTLRAKAWRDDVRCVKRGCACRRCLGKRSRTKGDSKAREGRKALAIPGANTRHEEHLGGLVRWEAKAGAQVKPMWSAFLRAELQSESQRPFGDNRPFVMTAAADGERDQLFACRLSKLPEVIAALAEQMGMTA
jgi:hypothetical protein